MIEATVGMVVMAVLFVAFGLLAPAERTGCGGGCGGCGGDCETRGKGVEP